MSNRQRNVSQEEWKSHFGKMFADTSGVIPYGTGKASIIEKASALAGYSRPHGQIPSARNALQQMFKAGELKFQNGNNQGKESASHKNLPAVRHLKRTKTVQTISQDSGGVLGDWFNLTNESYHALMILGNRVAAMDAEFTALRSQMGKINDMRNNVQEMLKQFSGQGDD